MKDNLYKIDCPICGMTLIDLNEGDPDAPVDERYFWCNDCNIDITVTFNDLEVE